VLGVTDLKILLAKNQFAALWRNVRWTEDAFRARLKNPLIFTVTMKQYQKLGKKEQAEMKGAAGAYLLGECAGGRRKANTVNCRSALTFDIDHITPEEWAELTGRLGDLSWIAHTTAGHTPEAPRWRLVMFISRELKPDEWEATERMFAQTNGFMAFVDPASFRVAQPMFFPGHPSDGEFLCSEGSGDALDVDAVLAEYADWRDITTWPTSPSESAAIDRAVKAQQDPLAKDGVIGAFNRAYDIPAAIETFLSDQYAPTDDPARYDYTKADSAAGLIVYGGTLAYSHHTSDPAADGHCHNAFDLVRLHKFGDLGEKESAKEMIKFAAKDERVTELLLAEKQESAEKDFTPDPDWKRKLTRDRSGLEDTLRNITLILQNDPALAAIVFNQLAGGMEIKGDVPWNHPARFWRDADDAQLISYVDANYGTFSQRNYNIAVAKVTDDRSYHPIREYFESLPPWDGVERVETLLIDYLGAEDNDYVKAVTRKTLCAAVARVYRSGLKFDNILVMNGPQGVGKSTLIARLGGDWYSDSLALTDMNDKTAAEKLQGYWLLEIGELAGMRKADIDKVKAFISRQDDKYRASFGRRVTPHPRQCVFFGTTNSEKGYLRDVTGNRRFWTVKTPGGGERHSWQLADGDVRQVWAKALCYVRAGERLYLDADLEALARNEQRDAMEQDEREGLVREYLDRLLPVDWESRDIYQRRDYLQSADDKTQPVGATLRDTVCNMEIWCECFGKHKEDLLPKDSYMIAAIMERMDGWEKSEKLQYLPIYGRQRVYASAQRQKVSKK
jgi:predicted P-loop ATPase